VSFDAWRSGSGPLRTESLTVRRKMDDGESIIQAVDALWEADEGGRVGELLGRLIDDEGVSPYVGTAWVRQAVRCDDDAAVLNKLQTLECETDRWKVVCREYVSYLGHRKDRRVLNRLVRKYESPIRASTPCWAAVGSAYRDRSMNRKVIQWMADWRSRADVEAGMLFPLVLAELAVKDEHAAAEVAGHAVGLTIDRSFDFHLIWLTAIGLLDQNEQQAVECFSRINPTGYNDYYHQLYGLLKAVLEVVTAEAETLSWPIARAQIHTARKAIDRENWKDPVVRRLYWRYRAMIATRFRNSPAVLIARLRAWLS
jgi:hypothetical protein